MSAFFNDAHKFVPPCSKSLTMKTLCCCSPSSEAEQNMQISEPCHQTYHHLKEMMAYYHVLVDMAGPLGRRGRWHEFPSRYNIVVVYKPAKDNDVAHGMSQWAYPAGLADDTQFCGSNADLKGYEDWEAQEKARNDALYDWDSISREGSESGPPCSYTAKCHGHCSGYSNLRAASHYPCFHYECPSLKTATQDKLDVQRRADALLRPKYRAQVTPDSLPAYPPLTADPPWCPDCPDHH